MINAEYSKDEKWSNTFSHLMNILNIMYWMQLEAEPGIGGAPDRSPHRISIRKRERTVLTRNQFGAPPVVIDMKHAFASRV